MLKKNVDLAKFALGIDQLSDETSLPSGAVRDAVNIDISDAGNVGSRGGFTKLLSLTGAHSLWGSRDGTYGVYAHGSNLIRVAMVNGVLSFATVMGGLTRSDSVSYFEYANALLFTNGYELGTLTHNLCWRLGIQDPPAISGASLAGQGTLPAGKYGLACTYTIVNGEESGLSEVTFLELSEQGGLRIELPMTAPDPETNRIRVYLTPVNGDLLYQVAEVPLGVGTFDLLANTPGKLTDGQFKRRMRGGSIVRVFNGRLLIARGNTLQFSEPYRYGLTDVRHGFIQFNSEVIMVEPTVGGVYVGTCEAVYFLDGNGPGNFTQSVVSTNAPTPGASTLVAPSALPEDMVKGSEGMVAVWLGRMGYSIGLSSGTVHDAQSDRISLPIYDKSNAVWLMRDGLKQVISIVESTRSGAHGLALDSIV